MNTSQRKKEKMAFLPSTHPILCVYIYIYIYIYVCVCVCVDQYIYVCMNPSVYILYALKLESLFFIQLPVCPSLGL
jgi:hypothetical protein